MWQEKGASMTNTSRNGMGARRLRAISVSHAAQLSFSPLPTRKLRRRSAWASAMEAMPRSGTHRRRRASSSSSDLWILGTRVSMAAIQSLRCITVSKRIHEASRMGAAIRSRRGMTSGWLSFRSVSRHWPTGSGLCSQCQYWCLFAPIHLADSVTYVS